MKSDAENSEANASAPPPRVGLVGLGYWGRNLARVFHELGALAAVCDADEAARQRIAERYPGLSATTDFGDLLDAGVDAVVIASPPPTHAPLAQQSLEAGKDVYVEKPLCHDLAEAEALRTLAAERQRVLMTGHLLRYHPAFVALLHGIESNRLGPVRYLEARRQNLGKVYTERDVLWNFAPHDVSLVLAAAGHRLPITVAAQTHRVLSPAVADAATLTLRFTDPDASATIHASWVSVQKEARLTVLGESGSAAFDDTQDWPEKVCWYDGHNAVQDGRSGRAGLPEPAFEPLAEGEPLRAEAEHFLECCRTRATPRTGADEARRVIAVLDAARASAEQNGIPVRPG